MGWGGGYGRAELLRRVGNLAQIAGIREYTYNSGRADGVRAVEVNNGALRFELLASRCLDIASVSYRGVPLGYYSKSGIRHPAFFAKNDPTGFHDNFLGGLLTTCGLHNTGPASECGGRMHQLHGEVANMPAEKVAVEEAWDGDEVVFAVTGEIRHASFYHEDLLLRRRIWTRLGAKWLRMEDEAENLDFAPTPCLPLYHIQFGFPLLDESAVLLTSPVEESRVRPGGVEEDARRFDRFGGPEDGAGETCFYHRFTPGRDGWVAACLFNPELGAKGLGGYVRFRTDTLPVFVQWKMLRSREYVCGLEPTVAPLDDRTAGDLAANTLQPLEKRRFRLELGVVEGREEFENLLERGDGHD